MAAIATDAATAREKMIHFLEIVKDERVLGLYTFLAEEIEEEIEQEDWEYPEELKVELDKRFEAYKNGEKTYSKEEVEAHTHELLKSLGVRK